VGEELIIDDVISVPGMHCPHCAMSVKRALSMVQGVKSVEADLESKVVRVAFNPSKVELGKLIEAIERAGYEAFPG